MVFYPSHLTLTQPCRSPNQIRRHDHRLPVLGTYLLSAYLKATQEGTILSASKNNIVAVIRLRKYQRRKPIFVLFSNCPASIQLSFHPETTQV